jgi:hypothetical protein
MERRVVWTETGGVRESSCYEIRNRRFLSLRSGERPGGRAGTLTTCQWNYNGYRCWTPNLGHVPNPEPIRNWVRMGPWVCSAPGLYPVQYWSSARAPSFAQCSPPRYAWSAGGPVSFCK